MGSIHMDNPGETEDIIAEPDEVSQSYFLIGLSYLQAYGWYVIGASLALYVYFKNRSVAGSSGGSNRSAKSPQELEAWQIKEEQRLRAVERLQQRYAQEAAIKAERQKQLDEEKRLAKLKEKEKLAGKIDVGHKTGGGDGRENSKKALRPEYNPLMGDSGSSGRVCFRRPGGGGG